jgi:hypothetical protein
MFGLAVVAIIAVGLLDISARRAEQSLLDARTAIDQVRADLIAGQNATADARVAQRDAAHARSLTHGVLWDLTSWLPPVQTARGLSDVAAELTTDILPPLVRVGPTLQPSVLRLGPDRIATAPFVKAAPTLASIDRRMVAARRQVAALPNGWIGRITSARAEFAQQLASVGGSLDDLARFARVGPDMLGDHGTRRYFVGVQNNAETKPTGGLVAAYAIVTADHGRIKVVERGNDSRLQPAQHPLRSLGPAYLKEYGAISTRRWASSNVSPNFPYAAAVWAHLWQAQSGQRVDGAIGVDPVALAALLSVAGPVKVGQYPTTFTGSNLAAFIESGEYAAFRGPLHKLRKPFLSEVAGAVLDELLSGAGSPSDLATALGQAAGQGHLQIWSSRVADQAGISGTPLAGELPRSSAPFAAVTFNDIVGSKLDYYLQRSLSYTATSCAGPRRSATISLNLLNTAPRDVRLPRYVRIRNDRGFRHHERVPAERLRLAVYATTGAVLTSSTVNGVPKNERVGAELGHPVFRYNITLPPGVPRRLVLHLSEPVAGGVAHTKVQPMARPQQTHLDVPTCH